MPKSSNPFAFLSNTSLLPNNNTQGLCFGASAVFAQMPKSNEVVFTNNAPIPTNNSQKDSTTKHSEYHTQIEKLNRSFLQWMEKQILNHPFGIWKDGVQVCFFVYFQIFKLCFDRIISFMQRKLLKILMSNLILTKL